MSDAALAARMGKAGRQRAVREFGWPAIAARTVELYSALLAGPPAQPTR
jgi:starch synthase